MRKDLLTRAKNTVNVDLAIETYKLTKHYGDVVAVSDLNLQVEKGKVFGFLGPNGAGKTTTIKTLLGLISPTFGSGSILGFDIQKDSVAIRKRIGYVSETANLYEYMTPEQLLKFCHHFHPEADIKKASQLLEAMELPPRKKIQTFSRGMKQKIYLLQAFFHNPELLILDEPTTGLDPIVRGEVLDLIKAEASEGQTVFICSHILSEIEKVCDTVGILREGKLLVSRNLKELKAEFKQKGKDFTLDEIFMEYMRKEMS